MKCKVLSLILALVMLFTTVAVGFNVSAEAENLIANGNFEVYEGYTPENWEVNLQSAGGASAEIVEDVEIADGVTANALKVTTTMDNSNRHQLTYGSTIKIEKNAAYTMTYWVKVSKIKGLRTYMFEPNYIAMDGTLHSNPHAAEGSNIYSYSYNNGSTRVIRTDIDHKWIVAATGTIIDATGPSMFISRSNNVEQVLTPDYPSTTKEGEWLQVVHTFATGNLDAHEADVAYEFSFPSAVGGEVWIADIKMNVVKSEVDDYYTPAVNDVKLGCVSTNVPLINGKVSEITAEPFGENTFDGWFVDGELVSSEETLTFTYDPNNPPKYEARFTKSSFGIDGSFESGYTNGALVAKAVAAIDPNNATTDWTPTTYLSTEQNNSGFYIESNYGGTWRQATISQALAHSGTTAIEFAGQYGMLGRKFSGLTKNTQYIFSAYVYSVGGGDGKIVGLSSISVTAADSSIVGLRTDGKIDYLANAPYEAVLAYNGNDVDATKGWTKVELSFNTKDNEDVILWLESVGMNAKMYIDDYSIARAPQKFTPMVNDSNLGTVTPNDITCVVGGEITVTATSVNDGQFKGWYIGDELKSTDLVYTFTYSDEFKELTAKFEAGKYTLPNHSLEDYESGKPLAQLVHTKNIGVADTDWTDTSFLSTTQDGEEIYYMDSNNGGTYRKALITSSYSRTGKNSIELNGLYGFLGRKFTGLEKNTDYIISFYGMVRDDSGATFGNLIVADPNTTIYDSKGSVKSSENFIARNTEAHNSVNEWTKATVTFNSGDNTEVMLWIYHNKTGKVYLDDFTICPLVKISVSTSRLGTTTKLKNSSVAYNSSVELTATPHEGNTFLGWYIDDELVSTNATHTFIATKDLTITPKFSGENTPNYEYFSTYGQDGTFENGTIEGWTHNDPQFDAGWCYTERNTNEAYEGNYSLSFFSRHRDSILMLNNLHAHTRYTLSFYFKHNTVGELEHMSTSAITPPDVIHASPDATNLIAKTDPIPFTGEWQKYEISFNSGNYEAVNFVLRYSSDSTNERLYIDNFNLEVGQYEAHAYDNACDADCNYCGEVRDVPDHVYDNDSDLVCNACGFARAPLFTPGNINGDETNKVDLQDVVILSQYVAGWQNIDYVTEALDPNGDGKSDLSDVVLLAQYVAQWNVTLSDKAYVPTE